MYTTVAGLKSQLPDATVRELTDDGNIGTIDDAIVEQAIVFADDLIDAHLRAKYALPLPEVPEIIRRLSQSLTIHELYKRRAGLGLTDDQRDQHKEDLRMLEMLGSGKVTLFNSEAPRDAGNVVVSARTKQFDEDTMEGYKL